MKFAISTKNEALKFGEVRSSSSLKSLFATQQAVRGRARLADASDRAAYVRAAGAAARREDLNVVVKRRAWAALARGLVVPVVLAERLDRYLRVVVAAAAPGEEFAPIAELARRRARPGEVEGRDETEVVRRPGRRW